MMLKKLNIHCYSYLVEKQLYHKNGGLVLTMSDWQGKALRVQTWIGVRVLVTGACQNSQALLSIIYL